MVYRIWRSPYSSFGGTSAEFPDDRTDETYTAPEHYKDELLREIAANGFNGIWAVVLRVTRFRVFCSTIVPSTASGFMRALHISRIRTRFPNREFTPGNISTGFPD